MVVGAGVADETICTLLAHRFNFAPRLVVHEGKFRGVEA
jgi:hypothetical protein